MKVFDRYAGREVDLPEVAAPGRFRLLNDAAAGMLGLAPGQLLVGDTWDSLTLGENGTTILPAASAGANQGSFELLGLALSTLVRAPEGEHFSPLMPASCGELAELEELERVLVKRIAHLREIDARPRMSMRYETEVAPLSRVRKLAPGALHHLATHSKDWHRRTLSGIVPKRVLGLFSEDDLGIYENRIYARLLEKLDSYLALRRDQITSLLAQFEQAMAMSGAENLDYRLRNDLCALWGRAFSGDETQHLLDASKKTLGTLASLRKQVRMLRGSTLYTRIPRTVSVPEQLRDTNILQHDQHYRHLRTLWRLHQQRGAGQALLTREVVARNLGLIQDYIAYIGRVGQEAIRHIAVLERRGQEIFFAGRQVSFVRFDDEWHLCIGETRLILVPTLHHERMEESESGTGFGSDTRVLVCVQTPTGAGADVGQGSQGDHRIVCVSPSDFYGLEKIKLLLEAFLWRSSINAYGRSLGKLPGAFGARMQEKGWLDEVPGGGLGMLAPIDYSEEQGFRECLRTGGLNAQTIERLSRDADNLKALSSCRVCARRTVFEPRENGFWSHCEHCATTARLWTRNGKREILMSTDTDVEPSFETMGARYLKIEIGAG